MTPPELSDLLREHFGHIYVINLRERADRRREVGRQLERVGLRFGDPFVTRFDARKPTHGGPFSNPGVYGCFQSHRDVLREAAEAGHDSVLVLEDDFDFSAEIGRIAGPVLGALAAKDWSHARLGHNEPRDGAGGVERITSGLGMITLHCIGWRGRVITEAADFLDEVLGREPGDPAGGPQPVDGAFNTFIAQRPDLEAYLAVPTLGFQRSSRSDIAAGKWFDRLPVARSLAGAARSVLRRG